MLILVILWVLHVARLRASHHQCERVVTVKSKGVRSRHRARHCDAHANFDEASSLRCDWGDVFGISFFRAKFEYENPNTSIDVTRIPKLSRLHKVCNKEQERQHDQDSTLSRSRAPALIATNYITMFHTPSKRIAAVGHQVVSNQTGCIGFARGSAVVTRTGAPAAANASKRLYSTGNEKKEHIIVALGGNALLKRGQDMTMENQRQNIATGMKSLKDVIQQNTVTLVHGNGPQVGLLVLESAAYEQQTGLRPMALDVLDAETEGMIGYLIEQELSSYLSPDQGMATVLSQILVDPKDPAFQYPTKFIGPIYDEEQATKLGLPVRPDGDYWRRVVPSPLPVAMVPRELKAVKLLVENDCLVICAGGGGIPVTQNEITKKMTGVEAVIDKDRAACMMGITLHAKGLLILTDVAGVATAFNTGQERWIKSISPGLLGNLKEQFADGSMGPKVESAIEFVQKTGGWAAIGSLNEADQIVAGTAGTRIEDRDGKEYIEYHNLDEYMDHAV